MTTDAVEAVRAAVEDAPATDDRPEHRRVEAAIAAIYADAEHTGRRQVDEVLSALEADGTLPEAQRDAVEDLADAIVGRLLAVPARSLREAADEGPGAVDAALALFEPGVDQDRRDEPGVGSSVAEVRDGD